VKSGKILENGHEGDTESNVESETEELQEPRYSSSSPENDDYEMVAGKKQKKYFSKSAIFA
jgi:hypothetical protein